METYEDDDDTHFCIKCHLTVTGLENYVRHRQSGCRPPEPKQTEVSAEPPSTPTTVTYPEILNADAFFSSLELQSSSKAPLRPRSLADRDRKSGRAEEKVKKKSRKGQEPDDGLKEKLLNMPPVVADLDDFMDHLGIPSLVGFPDIVTTTKSSVIPGKSVSTPSTKTNRDTLSSSPVESIIASSKNCGERKRNEESQRIEQDHGEWLDDAILVDLASNENKVDHPELVAYADYDYHQDEESEDNSPDEEIEESDSHSNDDEAEDREFRPRHSGGKWKPSELLHINEEEDIDEEENQEHNVHSGGKWKPDGIQRGDECDLKESGVSSLGSAGRSERRGPTGHTRGKWIPGAPGDLGSGYWCDPCGRKLASRLLYNRHLLSDLHARRSIQEIDGDSQLPRSVGPLLRKKPASKRQRALAEIKSKSKLQIQDESSKESRKKRRKRQKEVLSCEMCQARVRRPQMGKHLLSHYHCRVAGTNPCQDPAARHFILENMSNVVRQCPFQCSVCRFYCNTEDNFLEHWRSGIHVEKCENIDGTFKCTSCDFRSHDNDTMIEHLLSQSHREVVAMVNGSVPTVVGKRRNLVCETCKQRFRYNLQLRFHARRSGHNGNLTSSDEYQSRIVCSECSQVVRSLVALQRHKLSCHKREKNSKDDEKIVRSTTPYFCSFCSENFESARDAVLHRRTSSHKENVRAQKSRENLGPVDRECPYCGQKQDNLTEHKAHLLREHPELCHRCPRCGLTFALPQDVTRHTRDVDCTKQNPDYIESAVHSGEWKCSDCPFETDSRAEFLFHNALHGGIVEIDGEASSSKATPRYKCPICDKLFRKVTLRNHLRNHTGERPFRCTKCHQSFSRRSNLNIHRKNCSGSTSWRNEDSGSRRRSHACSECNAAFYTKVTGTVYVSYIETYKKRVMGIFWKRATMINYRVQEVTHYIQVEECCWGYSRLGNSEPIQCLPFCVDHCRNGKCVAPNQCECLPGYEKLPENPYNVCSPKCVPECINADCTAPNICHCHDGYLKHENLDICSPACFPVCGDHAQCVSPNKCSCEPGYEEILNHSWSMFHDGLTPTNFHCQPYCNEPCLMNSKCMQPNTCECDPGYSSMLSTSQICYADCNPPCKNSYCTEPGKCECFSGYGKNESSSNVCSPICNPPCENSLCIEPEKCECFPDYEKKEYSPNVCSPICYPPCENSYCAEPGKCECFSGYGKNDNSSHVCSPICDPQCKNSYCAEPGNCECFSGYEKNENSSNICSPICHLPCENSYCSEPGKCECFSGYVKNENSSNVCSPICDPPCENSYCSEPGKCECFFGYESNENSTHFCSPACDPPCENSHCTKPGKCECFSGYENNENSSNVCLPICDPPCENSYCTEPGKCECFSGYEKNDNSSNICSPICDPSCENSNCSAPGICECFSDYEKNDNSSTICLPICDPPCVNSNCTEPGKCECFLGFEKNENSSNVCSNESQQNIPNDIGASKHNCEGTNCDESFCTLTFTLQNDTSSGLKFVLSLLTNDFTETMTESDETEWKSQACPEKCKIHISDATSSGNSSELIVRCQRLIPSNATSHFNTTETYSWTDEQNETIICLIRAKDVCSTSNMLFLMIGIILAIVTSVCVLIFIVIRRKRKLPADRGVSMTNSIMTEWANEQESTYHPTFETTTQ